jgi:peroxiredoxin
MEAPSVEEASMKYRNSVTFVGVAWSGSEGSYRDFVQRHRLTFSNLDDSDGEMFRAFKISGQPAWAFVSQDGTAEVILGGLSASQLDDQVRELITG